MDNKTSKPSALTQCCQVWIRKGNKPLTRAAIMEIIQKQAPILPSFSSAIKKLQNLLREQNIDLQAMEQVLKVDPGLTSRYLKMISDKTGMKKTTSSIRDLLLSVDPIELKRYGANIAVLEENKEVKIRVDWKKFWLHNVLVARLTERLVGAYRELSGREYLAGLLHDAGKIFLEIYFPRELESILLYAMERGCGVYEAEKRLLEITHAEISAILCEKWNLHSEVIEAVRFHHEPIGTLNEKVESSVGSRLIAVCLSVADSIATICGVNIQGAKRINVHFEALDEWRFLKQQFRPIQTLQLDIELEIKQAQESIASTEI